MVEDDRGFFVPRIDLDKCIDCGLCDKVCDKTNSDSTARLPKKAFYVKTKNRRVLANSTSGGAFTILSDYVLGLGGLVCGAIMDANFNVKHVLSPMVDTRNLMRGSKYVQSEIGLSFKDIKKALSNDQYVLFVGTPCQTAGIVACLGNQWEKLITVDMLCHGVPNNKMFKDHIRYIENRSSKHAEAYSFRNKHYAWRPGAIQEIKLNGKWSSRFDNQAFVDFFFQNLSLRNSCYKCEFRKPERYSDFTIADFWDLQPVMNERDTEGVSLVTANSSKALDIIAEISTSSVIKEVPYDRVAYRYEHRSLVLPNVDIKEFWTSYKSSGYAKIVEKYYDSSLCRRVKFMIKKIVYKR